METHKEIVIGWIKEKVVFIRTFNGDNDRTEMMLAYEHVSENCDTYVMTSRFDNIINFDW